MGMAQAGAWLQSVVKHRWHVCSATLRRKSMALPMLDDGESSNTKLGSSSSVQYNADIVSSCQGQHG